MADRITAEMLGNALQHYLTACKAAGYTDEQLDGACIADPYAKNLFHVCRLTEPRSFAHDLPGFASSNYARTSKRSVYESLQVAAKTLFDLSDAKQAVR